MKLRLSSCIVATSSRCHGVPSGLSVKSGSLLLSLLMALLISHNAKVLAEDQYLFDHENPAAASGYVVFMKYCAGCHGFDGMALYEYAPSFSLGERMYKSDEELLDSVLHGKHGMPYWQDKLNVDMFRSAIAYLREMQQRNSSGLPPRQGQIPEKHYRFNPVGEDEDYWLNREQNKTGN